MSLENKVALVTGSGRGIGREIALELAKQGADVIINDLDCEGAKETAAMISEMGRKTIISTANIAQAVEVAGMFEQLENQFGGLDILVNNAGITRDALMVKMEEEAWDMVMNVNLKGVFLCCQAAASLMGKAGAGRIINLSSLSGQTGNVGQANYAASKAGVAGMTKTLARELARKKVTVNAVAPGFIITPMTEAVPEKIKDRLVAAIPLQRAGQPEDVAALVAFLASDEAGFITGQEIGVNGGMYI